MSKRGKLTCGIIFFIGCFFLYESLAENQQEVVSYTPYKTLVLEKENTLILNGEITRSLVAELQYKLHKMSYKLPLDKPIILVINTPGGSVLAGHRLIVAMGAVPQPVHTLVLNANSMGFYIAQAGKIRYTAPDSQYMAHRASLQGLSGELNGSLNSRLLQIENIEKFLQFVTALRLKMDLSTFQEKIKDEYRFSGFESKDHNAADEIVLPLCGVSLLDRVVVVINPTTQAMFYSCPLFSL